MGTNYYAVSEACGGCGRDLVEPLHLCKSFGTWAGHRYHDLDTDRPHFAARFATWAELRAELTSGRWRHVDDEYGVAMSIEEFVELADGAADIDRARQLYDNDRRWRRYSPPLDSWVDPAGYFFLGGDFS